MIAQSQAYTAGANAHQYRWPFCISLAAHLIFLGLVLYSPSWDRTPNYMPSVIDVQMVDLADLNPATVPTADNSKEAAAVVDPPKEKAESAPSPQVETAAKPEVSVAPPRKKTKTALKTKTFKSKKVLKNALKRVEKKVETLPPKPLEDTIKRLREKVAKQGKPTPETGALNKVEGKGKKGNFFSKGSQKEAELVDLYRLEIAYTINKNWAFSEQLAGASSELEAVITFKVMPDGQITEIYFMDRSGNSYLDESGRKAILKSSPVSSHPKQLNLPYVQMGINFGPKGVQ